MVFYGHRTATPHEKAQVFLNPPLLGKRRDDRDLVDSGPGVGDGAGASD